MTVLEKVIDIQHLLAEISMEHKAEIREYVQEVNYHKRVCNEQTMELRRLNGLLEERDEEIRRLRGETI